MNEIQGYLAIIPNSPDGRGMLYFTKEAAIEHKKSFEEYVEKKWGVEGHFKTWKEKPLPIEVYTLVIKDKIA